MVGMVAVLRLALNRGLFPVYFSAGSCQTHHDKLIFGAVHRRTPSPIALERPQPKGFLRRVRPVQQSPAPSAPARPFPAEPRDHTARVETGQG